MFGVVFIQLTHSDFDDQGYVCTASSCHNQLISPRQNGCHFADNIFICIFVNKKFCILIKILLKFVPKGPIDNSLGLVNGLALNRRQAIILTNADPIHWCIYVALGGDEFIVIFC